MRAVEAHPTAAAENIEEEGRRNYGSYFRGGFAEREAARYRPDLRLWNWSGIRTRYSEEGGSRRGNSCQGLERRTYRQDSRNHSGRLSGRGRSEKDLLDEHQAIDR